MDRHELGNMIFNLEDKKNLKEVKFTKSAVKEVLGYLKELYEIKDKEHEEDRRVADLEAKLAESEEMVKSSFKQNERIKYKLGLITSYNQELQKENDQLKQQLAEKEKYTYTGKEVGEIEKNYESQIAEKDQAIESLQEINQSLGQTCNNDAKEIERLNKLLAEKEKECAIWERAYKYAIFECDFYKNHTQTTNEETMKRIEQLYEKILKRAKLLMEDK